MDTQLYTRGGTQQTPNAKIKTRPAFAYQDRCGRCGGAGGSDKWAHTGFTCFDCGGSGKGKVRVVPLYTAEQLTKLNAAADRRQAKKRAEAEAAAAKREAERTERRAAYRETVADLLKRYREVQANETIDKMVSECDDRASMSDAQREWIERHIAECVRKAASSFVASVGERTVFEIKIAKILDWSNRDIFPRRYRYCHICRTPDGQAVKYIGSARLGKEGESVRFSAKVKAHETYKGERQTIVERPTKIETVTA